MVVEDGLLCHQSIKMMISIHDVKQALRFTITCLLFVLACEAHHNKDHRHAYRKTKKEACSLVVVVVLVLEKDYAYDDAPEDGLEKPIADVMKNKTVLKKTLLNASRSIRMQKGRIPSGHSLSVVNYAGRTWCVAEP